MLSQLSSRPRRVTSHLNARRDQVMIQLSVNLSHQDSVKCESESSHESVKHESESSHELVKHESES